MWYNLDIIMILLLYLLMYQIKSIITTTVIVVTIISKPTDIKVVIIAMLNKFSDKMIAK